MIRKLSQFWVSRSVDRGVGPGLFWRWTFGRLGSHRRFASQMNQLDAQLKRQAGSQRRAIEREPFPIGRYTRARADGAAEGGHLVGGGILAGGSGWLRPALMTGSLGAVLVLAVVGFVVWSNTPTQTPEELRAMATQSFDRVWEPLSRQAKTTGQALREQTVRVAGLSQKLPVMERVVDELDEAIRSPIREEVRRFAEDVARPWVYLAGQMPRLRREHERVPAKT
jgi:hypothetical protein